jgi:hypothetical protein
MAAPCSSVQELAIQPDLEHSKMLFGLEVRNYGYYKIKTIMESKLDE